MKQKTTEPIPLDGIEKDLEALAPLVQQAFGRIEGPSPATLRAIRLQAELHLARQRRIRRLAPLFKGLAAAAAAAVLLTGTFQRHQARLDGRHAQDVARLLHLSTAHPALGQPEGAGLANSLLDVQGLSEDSFLATADEEEPLWL